MHTLCPCRAGRGLYSALSQSLTRGKRWQVGVNGAVTWVHVEVIVSGPKHGGKWHSLCLGLGSGVYTTWAGAGGEQNGAGLQYTREQGVNWGRA